MIQINHMKSYLLSKVGRETPKHRPVSLDPWSPQGRRHPPPLLPPYPRPREKVKIYQGQRRAGTKPGDSEGYPGRTEHRSSSVRPTTALAQPVLPGVSQRVPPGTLPRLGSEAAPSARPSQALWV